MPGPERIPFNYVNLGELLTPSVRADFEYGSIIIDGGDYPLSGRTPAETRAFDWIVRKRTAAVLVSSVNAAVRILSPVSRIVGRPPPRPALVPLFAEEKPSAMIGVATRVELDSFEGRFSFPDERLLTYSLKETINLSENERGSLKMLEETKELVIKAIKRRRNLLCLFTLGGFFACLLSREEEIRKVSPHEGLLVPMAEQARLVGPTELISLFFLLRVKQLREDRIRILSPAEWIALVNYRDLLALRRFRGALPENKGYWSIIHPKPTEQVYRTGERDTTIKLAIRILPLQPKPGDGERSHPNKQKRRVY